jgi:hypothetical protein
LRYATCIRLNAMVFLFYSPSCQPYLGGTHVFSVSETLSEQLGLGELRPVGGDEEELYPKKAVTRVSLHLSAQTRPMSPVTNTRAASPWIQPGRSCWQWRCFAGSVAACVEVVSCKRHATLWAVWMSTRVPFRFADTPEHISQIQRLSKSTGLSGDLPSLSTF